MARTILKTISFLFTFLFIVSIIIYTFFNDPTDWSKPEKLTFFEVFYFACTTLSSVGYGDLYPKSTRARIMSMLIQLVTILGFVEMMQEYVANTLIQKYR